MKISKRQTPSNAGEAVEQQEQDSLLLGIQNGIVTLEASLEVFPQS